MMMMHKTVKRPECKEKGKMEASEREAGLSCRLIRADGAGAPRREGSGLISAHTSSPAGSGGAAAAGRARRRPLPPRLRYHARFHQFPAFNSSVLCPLDENTWFISGIISKYNWRMLRR